MKLTRLIPQTVLSILMLSQNSFATECFDTVRAPLDRKLEEITYMYDKALVVQPGYTVVTTGSVNSQTGEVRKQVRAPLYQVCRAQEINSHNLYLLSNSLNDILLRSKNYLQPIENFLQAKAKEPSLDEYDSRQLSYQQSEYSELKEQILAFQEQHWGAFSLAIHQIKTACQFEKIESPYENSPAQTIEDLDRRLLLFSQREEMKDSGVAFKNLDQALTIANQGLERIFKTVEHLRKVYIRDYRTGSYSNGGDLCLAKSTTGIGKTKK